MEIKNRTQNPSFGMSQLKNLKVLTKDSPVTYNALAAIDSYAKTEARNDGKNVILTMANFDNVNNKIAAYVKRPAVDIIAKIKSFFSLSPYSSAEYNPSKPVDSYKKLVLNADKILK